MLHTETIEHGTLELLRSLQAEPILSAFNLVGGTALALRIGHRKSIDLDLFTQEEFDLEELKSFLVGKYGMKVSFARGQTLKGFIDDVMIDCIRLDYPHLQNPDIFDGVRLESLPDIVAMKLSALTQNGSRIKDFIDIATLSTVYSFNEMLGFYVSKFPNVNVIMPLKSITYFGDIDFGEPIVMTSSDFHWDSIAGRLVEMVSNPDKVFETMP